VDDRVWADMLVKGSNDAAELADEEDAEHVSHCGLDLLSTVSSAGLGHVAGGTEQVGRSSVAAPLHEDGHTPQKAVPLLRSDRGQAAYSIGLASEIRH
jgi:hypothetical protein